VVAALASLGAAVDVSSHVKPAGSPAEMHRSDQECMERLSELLNQGNISSSDVVPLWRPHLVVEGMKRCRLAMEAGICCHKDMAQVVKSLSHAPGPHPATILVHLMSDPRTPPIVRHQAGMTLVGPKGPHFEVPEALLQDLAASNSTNSSHLLTLGALLRGHPVAPFHVQNMRQELLDLHGRRVEAEVRRTRDDDLGGLLQTLEEEEQVPEPVGRVMFLIKALHNAGAAAAPASDALHLFATSNIDEEGPAAFGALLAIQTDSPSAYSSVEDPTAVKPAAEPVHEDSSVSTAQSTGMESAQAEDNAAVVADVEEAVTPQPEQVAEPVVVETAVDAPVPTQPEERDMYETADVEEDVSEEQDEAELEQGWDLTPAEAREYDEGPEVDEDALEFMNEMGEEAFQEPYELTEEDREKLDQMSDEERAEFQDQEEVQVPEEQQEDLELLAAHEAEEDPEVVSELEEDAGPTAAQVAEENVAKVKQAESTIVSSLKDAAATLAGHIKRIQAECATNLANAKSHADQKRVFNDCKQQMHAAAAQTTPAPETIQRETKLMSDMAANGVAVTSAQAEEEAEEQKASDIADRRDENTFGAETKAALNYDHDRTEARNFEAVVRRTDDRDEQGPPSGSEIGNPPNPAVSHVKSVEDAIARDTAAILTRDTKKTAAAMADKAVEEAYKKSDLLTANAEQTRDTARKAGRKVRKTARKAAEAMEANAEQTAKNVVGIARGAALKGRETVRETGRATEKNTEQTAQQLRRQTRRSEQLVEEETKRNHDADKREAERVEQKVKGVLQSNAQERQNQLERRQNKRRIEKTSEMEGVFARDGDRKRNDRLKQTQLSQENRLEGDIEKIFTQRKEAEEFESLRRNQRNLIKQQDQEDKEQELRRTIRKADDADGGETAEMKKVRDSLRREHDDAIKRRRDDKLQKQVQANGQAALSEAAQVERLKNSVAGDVEASARGARRTAEVIDREINEQEEKRESRRQLSKLAALTKEEAKQRSKEAHQAAIEGEFREGVKRQSEASRKSSKELEAQVARKERLMSEERQVEGVKDEIHEANQANLRAMKDGQQHALKTMDELAEEEEQRAFTRKVESKLGAMSNTAREQVADLKQLSREDARKLEEVTDRNVQRDVRRDDTLEKRAEAGDARASDAVTGSVERMTERVGGDAAAAAAQAASLKADGIRA